MNRRNFLTSLAATGVLGASPLSARAVQGMVGPMVGKVRLLVQAEYAAATALAPMLAEAFEARGVSAAVQRLEGTLLRDASVVAQLLCAASNERLLGIMDTASAVLFEAMAASRGMSLLARADHRFDADTTVHQVTASGLDTLAWVDAPGAGLETVARFYVGVLDPGGPAHALSPVMAPTGDGRLISFLLAR